MNKALEEFCDAWLEAWTGNRPELLLTFYAEDAYYQDPARPAGLQGHAEMRPYFEKLLAANPDWVWKRVELIPESENRFALKWQAEIPIVAVDILTYGLDLVELQNGKIVRNEVYFDPSLLKP